MPRRASPAVAAMGEAGQDLLTEMRAFFRGESAHDAERALLFRPAPNAIQWIIGAEWGGSPTLYEQPKQWQVIRDYFALRCPRCNTGDGMLSLHATRAELESETLLEWDASLGEDTCPKCRSVRSELVERDLLPQYNRLHLCAGQRAGKTFIGAQIAQYLEHRVLTIAHSTPGGLQAHLGLASASKFHAMYLAASAVNAEETIWAASVSLRRESPWFLRYREWVKAEEARQPHIRGLPPWSYVENDLEIVNEHPDVKLTAVSGTTNAPAQRGTTRLWAFIDEISHMLQTGSTRSAIENYRVMWNSLETAIGHVKLYGGWPWLGTLASFTSPASRNDKGMELLGETEIDPQLYAVHAATWDFNPKHPRKNFEVRMRLDPVGTMRDFGAQPPGAEYPLIHDEVRFRALTLAEPCEPLLCFGAYGFRDATGHEYIAPRVDSIGVSRADASRFLAFDAGLTHDAFTGTCMYGVPVLDNSDRVLGVEVYQDWIFRVVPTVRQQVYFEAILDIIERTANLVPVAQVAFDHWQSVPLIQQARVRYGVCAEEETTLDADYEAFRASALMGRVHLLPPAEDDFDEKGNRRRHPRDLSPPGAVIYEICGLQQDPITRRVTNPRKGQERGANSDDAARVVVHAHRMVTRAGYTENQHDRTLRGKRQRLIGQMEQWTGRGAVVHPIGADARTGSRSSAALSSFTDHIGRTGRPTGRGW